VSSEAPPRGGLRRRPPAARRDAVRNYHRILASAREVLGESGAEASMEEIAARAGVGVGTVYRRFASKDALIDKLMQLALEEILSASDRALARTDGHGLEELLRALGQSFADHARYASLLLQRPTDAATARQMRAAIDELTARAAASGTVNPGITVGDIMALIWAMRGLVQGVGEVAPDAWQRFLDIQLAGMRAAGPLSSAAPMSARQLSKLAPRRRHHESAGSSSVRHGGTGRVPGTARAPGP
jgi:AcrR family transcriptional regulator